MLSPIILGTGEDIAILDLPRIRAEVVGVRGRIETGPIRPDGTPRKLIDAGRRAAVGWRVRSPLRDAIAQTYRWCLDHRADARL